MERSIAHRLFSEGTRHRRAPAQKKLLFLIQILRWRTLRWRTRAACAPLSQQPIPTAIHSYKYEIVINPIPPL